VLAGRNTTSLAEPQATMARVDVRDEDGRKGPVNTKTITIFKYFIRNKIGNGVGISETSETKVWCGKYTGNGRNLKYDR
jgi:hypothetical protein